MRRDKMADGQRDILTDKQKDILAKAGQLVKEAFPNTHGSVKFNLSPGQKKVKVKLEEDLFLEAQECRNQE